MLEAEDIAWFFDQYIDRSQRSDWRFAPLEADSLDDVAPACADRLRAAGVPVELALDRGVTHDFIKLGRILPEAETAQAAIGAALKAAFDNPN